MSKIKKHAFLLGLALLVSFTGIAEAGKSRSLGGNSMVNGRNFVASRSLGGHNLGSRLNGHNNVNMNTLRNAIAKTSKSSPDANTVKSFIESHKELLH